MSVLAEAEKRVQAGEDFESVVSWLVDEQELDEHMARELVAVMNGTPPDQHAETKELVHVPGYTRADGTRVAGYTYRRGGSRLGLADGSANVLADPVDFRETRDYSTMSDEERARWDSVDPHPVLTPEGREVARKFPLFMDPQDEHGLSGIEQAHAVRALNDLGDVLRVPEETPVIDIEDAGDELNMEMEMEGVAGRLMLHRGHPTTIQMRRGGTWDTTVRHTQVQEVIHEMGHALDYGVLRERRGESWDRLMETITSSPEVQRMAELRNNPDFHSEELAPPRTDPSWQQLSEASRLRVAGYTVSDEETFARAFAQWVAQRSGDSVGSRNLQDGDNWPIDGYAWTPQNFQPIADAMDAYFAEQGMLR